MGPRCQDSGAGRLRITGATYDSNSDPMFRARNGPTGAEIGVRAGAPAGSPGNPLLRSVNVGNPNEFTIRELAEKVVALTGSSSQIAFQNLPQDDPKQRQPDITLAAEKLGWAPQVMLDEGLPKTVDYFRKLLPELHAA